MAQKLFNGSNGFNPLCERVINCDKISKSKIKVTTDQED